jgi:hypothetical protein
LVFGLPYQFLLYQNTGVGANDASVVIGPRGAVLFIMAFCHFPDSCQKIMDSNIRDHRSKYNFKIYPASQWCRLLDVVL